MTGKTRREWNVRRQFVPVTLQLVAVQFTLAIMNLPLPPDEATWLDEMKRAWAEQFRFFTNLGKEEREQWVVREFLAGLGVSFLDTELRSPPQASKVDVEFRDAQFQVKEIADPNFRRGDEIKAIYRRVMAAQTLQDTVGPDFIYDTPPPANGYELVRNIATELAASNTYRDHKISLDLLCYVTRTCTSLISNGHLPIEEIVVSGWRSISCLIGQQSTVLFAAPDAPAFLRAAAR